MHRKPKMVTFVLANFLFFTFFSTVPRLPAKSFCPSPPLILYQSSPAPGKSLELEKCSSPEAKSIRLRLRDWNLSMEPVDLSIDAKAQDTLYVNDIKVQWVEDALNQSIVFKFEQGGKQATVTVPGRDRWAEYFPKVPDNTMPPSLPPESTDKLPTIEVDDADGLLSNMRADILPVLQSVLMDPHVQSTLQAQSLNTPEMNGPFGCLLTLLGWAASWIGFFDSCANKNVKLSGWKAFVCFVNSFAVSSGVIGAVAACFGIPF